MYPEKKGGSHKMARPQQNWGLLTLLTRWDSIWTMPNTASPQSEPPCGRAVYTPMRATILGHPPQKTAPEGGTQWHGSYTNIIQHTEDVPNPYTTDMSTAGWRLKSPQYIYPPHNGHTSQYHGHKWMTLETPRSRPWVWSKGKVIQWAQYPINPCPFHFTSIRPTIPYSHFEIWPWNIPGQGHEWGQSSMSHIIPSIQLIHFRLVSHQSGQPFLRYGQNKVWPWKNT